MGLNIPKSFGILVYFLRDTVTPQFAGTSYIKADFFKFEIALISLILSWQLTEFCAKKSRIPDHFRHQDQSRERNLATCSKTKIF